MLDGEDVCRRGINYSLSVSRHTASRKGSPMRASYDTAALKTPESIISFRRRDWMPGCSARQCKVRDRALDVVSCAANMNVLDNRYVNEW